MKKIFWLLLFPLFTIYAGILLWLSPKDTADFLEGAANTIRNEMQKK